MLQWETRNGRHRMKVTEKNSTSIVFTGDIAFDKYMDGKWEDEHLISDEILDFLHSADHVVANVEGAVCTFEQDKAATGEAALVHTIDPAAMKVFRRMHADIWNINNNHVMDAGQQGLLDTLANAKSFGAKTIGAGRNLREAAQPLFLEEAGGIGMFAVGYRPRCRAAGPQTGGCLPWTETDLIRQNISDIKKRCRWCVIVCHGGEEFTSLPSPYVRDRYRSFLDMGADLVVCHHPHVPNNYETFPGKAIFYSLGNFIFDTDYQRAQYNTEKAVLLKLNFTEDAFTFEPLGIRIQRDTERVVSGPLPDIFTDVQEEEYEKLSPLAAKMFLEAVKRQHIFLFPEKFADASEADWEANFMDPDRFERFPNECLDFRIIYPLAQKSKEGAWKTSALSRVRDYILAQMDPLV